MARGELDRLRAARDAEASPGALQARTLRVEGPTEHDLPGVLGDLNEPTGPDQP